MATYCCLIFQTLVLTWLIASPQQSSIDQAPIQAFVQSVDDYMMLRRQLERHLPPLEVSDDGRSIRDAVQARTVAIQHARATARAGDIFNAQVDKLFRSRLSHVFTAGRVDVAALLREMNEHAEPWRRAVVNGRFIWTTAAATPPSVLAVLPVLPPGIQYRFIGTDLALVDVDASVILDVLTDVIDPTV